MGSKAGGSNAAAAIGADTLLALPLVENLSKDVQPRLVHDLWGQERRGDQGRQETLTSCSHPWPMAYPNPLPKLTGAPGSTSGPISREEISKYSQGKARLLSFNAEAHQNPSCYQGLCRPGRSSHT